MLRVSLTVLLPPAAIAPTFALPSVTVGWPFSPTAVKTTVVAAEVLSPEFVMTTLAVTVPLVVTWSVERVSEADVPCAD